MLKVGFFTTDTEIYSTYEIIEQGFYRIDFVDKDSVFQVDVSAVRFSQVSRKNTYTYGDPSIYEKYNNVLTLVESARLNTTKSARWDDGEFVEDIHSESEKLGYKIDTKKKNGVVFESTIVAPGYAIYSYISDPIYGVKLDPINFSMYEKLNLVVDTVSDSSGKVFHTLDFLKRRYDLEHLDTYDFVVATDVDTAAKRLQAWKDADSPCKGFDTETTGIDICLYGEDKLVGVILAENERTATYYPFRHVGDFNLPLSFLKTLCDAVKTQEDVLVGHNIKFDREVMLSEGYDIRFRYDTMQLSIILNPVLQKGTHALKTLMDDLLHVHFLELTEIFIDPKDIDFSVLPVDIVKYYACPDATNVITLLKHQLSLLPKYQYKLADLECALANSIADQEFWGIRVNTLKYERQYRNCNYILDILLKAFRTLTHEDGNINSPQVLLPLIYQKMRCKVLLRTETGQPSTSSSVIKKLASLPATKPADISEDLVDLYGNVVIKASDLAKAKYPALVILSKYREYNKLKTAFYARFERTMRTGRVFFWVNQNGAATGRQSSPMHQLPPELKDTILSDTPKHDFWGPDFSQVELRMIAYLAKEKELIELAKDPDNDIHRIIGHLISGKEMWEITKEERSVGKRRNFGVVYLISARGLAGQIFGAGYTPENVEFCQAQLDDFYKKFKRIDRYIKSNGKFVKKNGYMSTAWFNRRRLFPDIFDPNLEPSKRASILRMSNNVPVQGTAADLLKLALVLMDNHIRQKGWNQLGSDGFPIVRIMLSIHDEIIISADRTIPYEEIVEMITKCMEIPVDDAPPFFVQPARMNCWGGHSDDAVAMPIRFRDKIIEEYDKTGVSVFKNSYFKLIVPSEVKQELASSSGSTSDLVVKYADKCTLEFVEGNFTQDFTQEHVKDALACFIESGFDEYRIDNYLDLLNEFRDAQLHDYMAQLIAEYGTNYKEVSQHVRHPSYTHELIAKYSKQLKGKGYTHIESIEASTQLYIEDALKSGIRYQVFKFTVDTPQVVADKDKFLDELDCSVNFDKDGNVVYAEEGDDNDVEFAEFVDIDPDDVVYRVEAKPTYVYVLGDAVVFDCNDLIPDDVNKVLEYIFKIKQADGFYKAMLIYRNKLVSSTMSIEQIDEEDANDFMINLVESGKKGRFDGTSLHTPISNSMGVLP